MKNLFYNEEGKVFIKEGKKVIEVYDDGNLVDSLKKQVEVNARMFVSTRKGIITAYSNVKVEDLKLMKKIKNEIPAEVARFYNGKIKMENGKVLARREVTDVLEDLEWDKAIETALKNIRVEYFEL